MSVPDELPIIPPDVRVFLSSEIDLFIEGERRWHRPETTTTAQWADQMLLAGYIPEYEPQGVIALLAKFGRETQRCITEAADQLAQRSPRAYERERYGLYGKTVLFGMNLKDWMGRLSPGTQLTVSRESTLALVVAQWLERAYESADGVRSIGAMLLRAGNGDVVSTT